jgi:monofunctional biosynthetic peptidoglycan transglycosylase
MKRRRKAARARSRRRRGPRRILVVLGAVLLVVLAATVVPVAALRWIHPITTSFMTQRRIAAWWSGDRAYQLRYRWIRWDEISPHAGIAVVAAEDQKFPVHGGFDLEAIEDARREYEDGGRRRGASTISQQVAKNLFLWPNRTWVRKGLEAYFTVLIEHLWSKRRILEVYLNVAEFGRGVFGVGAASEVFFDKPAARLTPGECARLAAVLPNPMRLHADRPSAYVLEREGWILGQMERLGGLAYLRGM